MTIVVEIVLTPGYRGMIESDHRTFTTKHPILANPSKGGDAKPWIYNRPCGDYDSQVAEDEPRLHFGGVKYNL